MRASCSHSGCRRPEVGARQALTVVLAWLHACIGRALLASLPAVVSARGALALRRRAALAHPRLAGLRQPPAARWRHCAKTPGWTEAMLRAANAPDPAEAAHLLAIRRGFLDTLSDRAGRRRRPRAGLADCSSGGVRSGSPTRTARVVTAPSGIHDSRRQPIRRDPARVGVRRPWPLLDLPRAYP